MASIKASTTKAFIIQVLVTTSIKVVLDPKVPINHLIKLLKYYHLIRPLIIMDFIKTFNKVMVIVITLPSKIVK